jgi:hypothetical protein
MGIGRHRSTFRHSRQTNKQASKIKPGRPSSRFLIDRKGTVPPAARDRATGRTPNASRPRTKRRLAAASLCYLDVVEYP